MTVAPMRPGPPLSAVTEDLEATPAAPGTPGTPAAPGTPWPAPRMSRCGHCGSLAYPPRELCHRCGQPGGTAEPLTPSGRLYTWSTVHVSASRPVPYTIGYVDLDAGCGCWPGSPATRGARMGTAGTAAGPGRGELTFAVAWAAGT